MLRNIRKDDIFLRKMINAGMFLLPVLMMINNLFYKRALVEDCVLAITTVLTFALLSMVCLLPYHNSQAIKVRSWISVTVGIVLGIVSTVANSSGYGSVVQYANLVLLLSFYLVYPISKTQRRILFAEGIASIAVVLIIFSGLNEIDRLYYSIIPGWQVESINPNTVGLLYFFLFALVVLLLEDVKKSFLRLPIIFAAWLGAIYFTHLSQSRAALTTVLIFGIVVFVASFIKVRRYPAPWLVLLGLALTVGITIFYIFLYRHTNGNVVILGKNLFTGREDIWQEIYGILSDHWLLGYNNRYMLWEGRLNSAHNALLGVWFTLGLIPTLVVCERIAAAFEKKPLGRLSRDAVLAIFASMILMCVETVLTDSMLYFYFVLFFLRISDSERERV